MMMILVANANRLQNNIQQDIGYINVAAICNPCRLVPSIDIEEWSNG